MSSFLLIVSAVLLTFTSILAGQQTDSQASKAADTYLNAVKIIELPEGKTMVAQGAWNWGGQPRHYPVYSEAKTLFEGMFSTDLPEIMGYKRLVELKVLTESGGITIKHYMLISYKDKSLGTWKVLTFREAADPEHESFASLPKPIGDKCVDASSVQRFTPNQLAMVAQPCQVAYARYGDWSFLAGKISQARDAYQKASDTNKQNPLRNWSPDHFDSDLQTIASITGR